MRYTWVVLAFVASLCAKQMLVTLPILLLLLDWWPLRRFGHTVAAGAPTAESRGRFAVASIPQLLREKLPLLALSAVFMVVAYRAQHGGGALSDLEIAPWRHRLANAVSNVPWYVERMVAPVGLAFHYPFAVPSPTRVWYAVGFVVIVTTMRR